MNFRELSEFSKEFKRLSKKYKSLFDDIGQFKKVVSAEPLGTGKHFNLITKNGECSIIKARLFCRYLKGSSLRIIYAFHCGSDIIEFLELYTKSEKPNHDYERIKVYVKNIL